MRKAMPHVSEKYVVTSQVRQLLALILCDEGLVNIEHAATYADMPLDAFRKGLESLKAGDSRLWTLLKDEVDEIHHALAVDQDELGVPDTDFALLWRNVWERSIYGSPQNLIVTQANIRHQFLEVDSDGLHKVTHAIAAAAYDAYCRAGRFDRSVTIVINGKLLREAVSVEENA